MGQDSIMNGMTIYLILIDISTGKLVHWSRYGGRAGELGLRVHFRVSEMITEVLAQVKPM